MIVVHFERDPNAGVHLIAKMLKCTRIDRMTNKNRTEFIAEIVVSIPKMRLSVCVCVCVCMSMMPNALMWFLYEKKVWCIGYIH